MVPRVEKPACSARAAQPVSVVPPVPGTVFGRPIPTSMRPSVASAPTLCAINTPLPPPPARPQGNLQWTPGEAEAAGFRRLRIRWEIRDDIHEAFLRLGCAIICLRRLTSLSPLLGVHLPGFRTRIDWMLGG